MIGARDLVALFPFARHHHHLDRLGTVERAAWRRPIARAAVRLPSQHTITMVELEGPARWMLRHHHDRPAGSEQRTLVSSSSGTPCRARPVRPPQCRSGAPSAQTARPHRRCSRRAGASRPNTARRAASSKRAATSSWGFFSSPLHLDLVGRDAAERLGGITGSYTKAMPRMCASYAWATAIASGGVVLPRRRRG